MAGRPCLRTAKSAFGIVTLVPLEVLHCALVLLGGGAGLEGAEIAAPAGLGIDLARIEAVAARRKLRIMSFS